MTLGTQFLTGHGAVCNTALAGQSVTLSWVESKQNFVITGASGSGDGGNVCTSKNRELEEFGDTADFTVTNPCTGDTLNVSFTPTSSNGIFICSGNFDFVQAGAQYTSFDYEWKDAQTGSIFCTTFLLGVTKNTIVTVDSGVLLDFTQPFTIFFNGEELFEFP